VIPGGLRLTSIDDNPCEACRLSSRPTASKSTGAKAMNDLLRNVLEAHGGLARWNEFSNVRRQIVTGGGLWALKGLVSAKARCASQSKAIRNFPSFAKQ
jgi:hypothetical protein